MSTVSLSIPSSSGCSCQVPFINKVFGAVGGGLSTSSTTTVQQQDGTSNLNVVGNNTSNSGASSPFDASSRAFIADPKISISIQQTNGHHKDFKMDKAKSKGNVSDMFLN